MLKNWSHSSVHSAQCVSSYSLAPSVSCQGRSAWTRLVPIALFLLVIVLHPLLVQSEQHHRRLQVLPSGAACGDKSPGAIRNALCDLLDSFDKKEEAQVDPISNMEEMQVLKEVGVAHSRNAVDMGENWSGEYAKEAEQKYVVAGSATRRAQGQITSGTAPQDIVFVQIVDVDQGYNNDGVGRIFGGINPVTVGSGFPSADPSFSGKPQTKLRDRRKKKHKRRMTDRKKQRGSSLHADRGSTGRIFGGTSSEEQSGTAPYFGKSSTKSKGKGKTKSSKGATQKGKGQSGKGSKGKGSSKSMSQSDLGRIFGGPSSNTPVLVASVSKSKSKGSKGGSKMSKGSPRKSKGMHRSKRS